MTTTSFMSPCSFANCSARSLRSAAAAAASLGPAGGLTPPPSLRPPAGPMAFWYPARFAAASAAAFVGFRVSIPPHPPLCPSFVPFASNPAPLPPIPLAMSVSHSTVISSRSLKNLALCGPMSLCTSSWSMTRTTCS